MIIFSNEDSHLRKQLYHKNVLSPLNLVADMIRNITIEDLIKNFAN